MKAIKVLLLLVLLGALGVGLYVYSRPAPAANGPGELKTPETAQKTNKKADDKPRVEEKYGFTSQGVAP